MQPEVAGCPKNIAKTKSRSLDFGFLASSVWRGVANRATPHGWQPVMGGNPSQAHGRVLDCCAGAPCSAWCLKTPSQNPIQIDRFWLPGGLRVGGGRKKDSLSWVATRDGRMDPPWNAVRERLQPEVAGCPNKKKLQEPLILASWQAPC